MIVSMNVYVGMWELLPPEWEGINGLYEKTEEEIREEVHREANLMNAESYIGIYTLEEFENEFNFDDFEELTGIKYWIKIM